jgi:hypothetical protein
MLAFPRPLKVTGPLNADSSRRPYHRKTPGHTHTQKSDFNPDSRIHLAVTKQMIEGRIEAAIFYGSNPS